MIITDLWRQQPGKYFCISTKSSTGKWRDNFFSRDQFGKIRAFIKENSDKDIYFCIHGFLKPERVKQQAVLPKALWADLDAVDPRKVDVKPTIAIESSPGRFVGLWLTDQTVTEELNRALTYKLDADKGGWDVTQVLRVPGTTNYKYMSTPKVRLIWDDGPSYQLRELEKILPTRASEKKQNLNVANIFEKYQNKMPHWCRRELLSGKATPGKRSEMIWKLENTLLEAGCSKEESFALIKASAWNKFRGRRNEDGQLQRELDKIIRSRLGSNSSSALEEINGYEFLTKSLDQVEEEEINWLWHPYLARGELTIVEGDPGLGKSYLVQMVSLAICDGKGLPRVKRDENPVKGKVAYFDIENSSGTVTKKRLRDNGMVNYNAFFQEEQVFSVDNEDQRAKVEEALEKLKPDIIVFDTINTYIGKADTHKASDTQQALGWFRLLAKRFNCSVIVLRHLTKGGKDKALYRGQGSIAFTGLARVVITVGLHPDDPDQRLMAVTKLNVTRPPRALSFTIQALPDRGKEKDRSQFTWGDFVDYTSDDIVNVTPQGKGNKDAEEADKFLRDVLGDGAVEISKIEVMAEKRSITKRSLYKAADHMGIVKVASGFGKNKMSMWELP